MNAGDLKVKLEVQSPLTRDGGISFVRFEVCIVVLLKSPGLCHCVNGE